MSLTEGTLLTVQYVFTASSLRTCLNSSQSFYSGKCFALILKTSSGYVQS